MDPFATPDRPVAGRDYPADWDQFQAFFPDEEACLRYLERLSWPHGFLCPGCGRDRPPWRGSRQRLVCRECGHQTTVTAGTLFQGTRTPLLTWFAAAWLVATAEQGVSARQLARALDLGSYETAWTMLHRFRRAMVRSGRPRLEGRVELGTLDVPGRPDPAGEGRQLACRPRREPLHADAAGLLAAVLEGDGRERPARGGQGAELDPALQPGPAGADHGPAEPVQHRPGRLVAAQLELAGQVAGGHALLGRGHQPGGGEPLE